VQNFPVVNMFDSQSHLDKPVQDLVLTITDFSNLFLIGDFSVQIATISIVHDDAETPFVHK
jgi:hypothetical protein